MRDIKFRAWDNVKDQMYFVGEEDDISFELCSDGSFVGYDLNEGWDSSFPKLEHLQYMQYIGLKDKYDTDIYEGDIIDCEIYGQKHRGIVKYADTLAVYFLTGLTRSDTELWLASKKEIVGNIHEHPHLLKEERT